MIYLSLLIFFGGILVGCSEADEVLLVGTPFNDKRGEGIDFHSEITDQESINKLRNINDKLEEIAQPDDLRANSDAFFTIHRPEDSVSELSRYIWCQDDGSMIWYDGRSNYYRLSEQQSEELKEIMEE
ncbi:hypothetical protein [Oceanobacillus damuensis]|uniref:hypothetical protein n=1 Tax=Oceanobacillus damuensis TaxID=937928 RepID=UPI000829B1CB|nr:hypothetical protein [Oceanobacillus damuensis]